MQSLKQGILIALEGIDGSGKSTLARNLMAALQAQGLPAVLTKEPGDSKLGALVRTIVQKQDVPICSKAEFLLFAADRAQHFEELIEPMLQEKKIIISDRMADSSIVYQGFGRGLSIEMIKAVNAWVMNGRNPDLVLYLRISPEAAMQRLRTRSELTAFEAEQNFQGKILAGFDELYKNQKNVIILDGTQCPETLTQQALNAILACKK